MKLNVFHGKKEREKGSRALDRFLAAAEAVRDRELDAEVARLKSPGDVRRWQARIRARIEDIFGALPKRTPLHARTVGKIELARVTIEKVIFESQPRYYVTANLYIPKNLSLPAPGILVPCGHDPLAKGLREYHKAGLGLALKGYISLVFDPTGQGERSECIDPETGRDLVKMCVCQHHWTGKPCCLTGMTLAGYRVWDGVRCVDYLLSRREVDARRIGVMGNSGGGAMTLLITAADERVAACSASHPGGSMENTYLRGQRLVDRILYPLIAPRPCHISVGRASGEEAAHRRKVDIMMPFYRACGRTERLAFEIVPGIHDLKRSKREAAYAWFNRWFAMKGGTRKEPRFKALAPEMLLCTKTGHVQTSLGGETMFSLNKARAARIAPRRRMPRNIRELEQGRAAILAKVEKRISLERVSSPLKALSAGTSRLHGVSVERLVFESEPGIPIAALLVTPGKVVRGRQVIIHVSDAGKPRTSDPRALPFALARRGHRVLSIDARDTGETSICEAKGSAEWRGYEPSLWRHECLAIRSLGVGRTLLAMRALDVIRGVDFVEEKGFFSGQPAAVVGEGKGGIWALLAAAFDERIGAVAAVGTLASWRMLADNRYYNQFEHFWVPGALEDFDIPDLAALVAPRAVEFIGAVDHMGRPVPDGKMRRLFGYAVGAYRVLFARGELDFRSAASAASAAHEIARLLRRARAER